MNLMNDPIPNQNDIELNTEKAGGVAGKVDRDQIVAETYIQVNNPAPTENAVLTLDIDPSKYTQEERISSIDGKYNEVGEHYRRWNIKTGIL
jgi:hypothetical protein